MLFGAPSFECRVSLMQEGLLVDPSLHLNDERSASYRPTLKVGSWRGPHKAKYELRKDRAFLYAVPFEQWDVDSTTALDQEKAV
jgi:hypothetical protein